MFVLILRYERPAELLPFFLTYTLNVRTATKLTVFVVVVVVSLFTVGRIPHRYGTTPRSLMNFIS